MRKKAIIRNKKIKKEINFISKSKHIAKVVEQPLVKLV